MLIRNHKKKLTKKLKLQKNSLNINSNADLKKNYNKNNNIK